MGKINCCDLLNIIYRKLHINVRNIGFDNTIYIKYLDEEKYYKNIPFELSNPNKLSNMINITKYFSSKQDILLKILKY